LLIHPCPIIRELTIALKPPAKKHKPLSSSELVQLETNAWEAMQLWKNEILVDEIYSDVFDTKVFALFEKSDVKTKTVQDIRVNLNDPSKSWRRALEKCCVSLTVLEEKLDEIFAKTKALSEKARMVPVDYKIADSELSHLADLEALRTRVLETFDWYKPVTPPKKGPTFVAPYFPFIQSSGMGKTKLLFELGKALNEEKGFACHLVLSGNMKVEHGEIENKERIFSVFMDLHRVVSTKKDQVEEIMYDIVDNVMEQLDKYFSHPPAATTHLVLLFDEAQVLLEKNFGIDAFLFQCICLWIRKARQNFHCAAVFASTTSSLSNFYPDERLVRPLSTRSLKGQYLPSGEHLPLPFYQTTTIGCFLSINSANVSRTVESSEYACTDCEYNHAIPYGRPLFAKMAENSQLEDHLDTVLGRMLLSDYKDWESKKESCLSILATRVQMGQTSTQIASRLIAKGYANLVDFSDSKIAQICYVTDPVCARLAMAMMDADFSMNIKGFRVDGKPKDWWVEQAVGSFSSGLCKPGKGDTGEVFLAMYLLFCGDLLRKKIDPSYRQFSVPLDSWVSNLIKPPTEAAEDSGNLVPAEMLASCPSVSFIQVCRNYFRLYESYEFVTSQPLLESLYKSGTAFYAYPTCPDFDIVASIRYLRNSTQIFAPLLISVKARDEFCPDDACSICTNIERTLKKTSCHRALGLVIVIGASKKPDDTSWSLTTNDVFTLFDKKNFGQNMGIARVLRIPIDDSFGISRALVEGTSDGKEMSEILISHSFIKLHATIEESEFVSRSMRKNKSPERKPYTFLTQLTKQLRQSFMAREE
jgi:hypothetical protein